MRAFTTALFIIITIINCLFTKPSHAQYLSIEAYPSGDIFLAAGKNLSEHLKIDIWSTPGAEVGCSMGPKIGIFNVGFGASAGQINDQVDLSYVNTDIGFGLDIGSMHWQSFNLYQFGQNGIEDFILARQWIDFGGPVGIVGHNIKSGGDDWKLNWGVYYDFGKIGPLAHSKVGLTKNVNGDGAWAVWTLDF